MTTWTTVDKAVIVSSEGWGVDAWGDSIYGGGVWVTIGRSGSNWTKIDKVG